jgi:hypothetical protein
MEIFDGFRSPRLADQRHVLTRRVWTAKVAGLWFPLARVEMAHTEIRDRPIVAWSRPSRVMAIMDRAGGVQVPILSRLVRAPGWIWI